MFALRRTGLQTLKRTYANEAAASDVLKLQFALPYNVLYQNQAVKQVNLPLQSGRAGILPNHVPIVEQLSAGIVEVFEKDATAAGKKYFVSSGFASVQPDSTLNITCAEAFELSEFDLSKVQSLKNEAEKNLTSSDEVVATDAKIQFDLLTTLENELK
ncbi:hypothetical protein QEN19_003638 [Hanseniaspora menglaensis]